MRPPPSVPWGSPAPSPRCSQGQSRAQNHPGHGQSPQRASCAAPNSSKSALQHALLSCRLSGRAEGTRGPASVLATWAKAQAWQHLVVGILWSQAALGEAPSVACLEPRHLVDFTVMPEGGPGASSGAGLGEGLGGVQGSIPRGSPALRRGLSPHTCPSGRLVPAALARTPTHTPAKAGALTPLPECRPLPHQAPRGRQADRSGFP